ncbi:BCL2/adenovirus E1B 19 kDa protein-interacting protein 3-like isoform X3 [Cimex lectularius]|uniref:BCL2/adenovirus E1B 19 kDa protein-interacting protein 3 n=1 Tax=Cimex lectularius TaxID=79782 RepID=A0A8I6R929_CIMLE|nr:BCL2/adenovirus E1B 19 kDa protein-interacting protein 3-like isoform X3 [Cimex lectularius]
MTTTPTSIPEETLGESWVEVGPSPERTTPLSFAPTEEYLRLLREAQRESNHSSARVSLASSKKGSPKSPPNSPNTELSMDEELKGVYINYNGKEEEWVGVEKNSDWIWDWSSRPDQFPPKDWKLRHPARKTLSIRTTKVGKVGLFSREMMYTILITNVLSLILGTGMGVWLSRRGCMMSTIKLD